MTKFLFFGCLALSSLNAFSQDCLTLLSADEKVASTLKQIEADYSTGTEKVASLSSKYVLGDELSFYLRFDLVDGRKRTPMVGMMKFETRTCQLLDSTILSTR